MNIMVKIILINSLVLTISGCLHTHIDEDEIIEEQTPDTEMGMTRFPEHDSFGEER